MKNFTVYSLHQILGDIIENKKTYIDENGSHIRELTIVFDLYEKPLRTPDNVLVCQNIWRTQSVLDTSINKTYNISNNTFLFVNGSINASCSSLNWTVGTPVIAKIMYGTGEYINATGFVEIITNERIYDECLDAWKRTTEYIFHFDN